MKEFNRRQALGLVGAGSLFASGAVRAQGIGNWPNRPLRIVIPTAAGGALDGMARLIGERLSEALKQPVIVDNRAGASGAIAYAAVAKSQPDGYTLVMTLSTLVLTSITSKTPGYTLKELTPLTQVATMPNGLAVGKDVPASTLREFIAWAKTKDAVYFGSSGAGSSANLLGSLFAKEAKLNMIHVPFKGDAPAVQATLGGQLSAVIGAAGSFAEHAKAGQMKILAVASPKRLRDFPDVPTFAEVGYPAVSLPGWSVMAVQSATPAPIVEQLSREVAKVVKLPEVRERIFAYGFQPEGTALQEARLFLKAENEKWASAVRTTGFKVE